MTNQYDLVIIGSGPGGYVAAIRAGILGLKTLCIEKNSELGGTCLNVGCIPSKSLLQSSELYYKAQKKFLEHGIQTGQLSVDFDVMMARKNKIVASFGMGIKGLFKKHGVESLIGTARFISLHELVVETTDGTKEISAKHILLATGSQPSSLPFLPFDEEKILSSTGALALKEIPKKLLVIGAGVIGVELGSVYKRLGSEVIFLEFLDRICPTLDQQVSKSFQQILEKQGLTFRLSCKVETGSKTSHGVSISYIDKAGTKHTENADKVLVAVGRKPSTSNLGLETLGIDLDPKGFVVVNSFFQTKHPHIYAIGDIIDGPMLAHKASEEGVVVVDRIKGLSSQVNYMAIPNVVYTDPEVASVGLTEEEAKAKGLDIIIGIFPLKACSRARCAGEDEGFVKILALAKSKKIIGLHILGAHAGELIAAGCIAIAQGMTIEELAETPFAHPTFSEAIKEAALASLKQAIHF